MSLMLPVGGVATTDLTRMIRSRIREGAAVAELTLEDTPPYLALAVGDQQVEAIFQSEHAAVAVLTGGKAVVRKAPRG